MAQEKYRRHCTDFLLLVWRVRQMAINIPGPWEPTGSAGTGLLLWEQTSEQGYRDRRTGKGFKRTEIGLGWI